MDELFVQEYMVNEYPSDPLYDYVPEDLTFQELFDRMCDGEDFYDIVCCGDSVVREHVFEAMCNVFNCDYEDIYQLWLNGIVPEL